jgi:uncharacterized protein (TIGR02453 family)
MAGEPCFTPALFAFLTELKAHNDRAWFAEHTSRYVADVEAPMLAFIARVGERLPEIASAFIANRRRVGGSLFRIHRDTRFSEDKSPFKTWTAARFRHRGPYDGVPPAFYFHLGPGQCFAGGGVYHADSPTVTRIRQRIVSAPDEWGAVRALAALDDDRLKRVPPGYDARHPYANEIKYRNFYALVELAEADVCAPDFLDRYLAICREVSPLVRFVTGALELRWQGGPSDPPGPRRA